MLKDKGKFHMEMVVWHNAHWATWGRQEFFDDIFPELYETLLPSSLARAQSMGWEGARYYNHHLLMAIILRLAGGPR